jgi:hypothetical protein
MESETMPTYKGSLKRQLCKDFADNLNYFYAKNEPFMLCDFKVAPHITRLKKIDWQNVSAPDNDNMAMVARLQETYLSDSIDINLLDTVVFRKAKVRFPDNREENMFSYYNSFFCPPMVVSPPRYAVPVDYQCRWLRARDVNVDCQYHDGLVPLLHIQTETYLLNEKGDGLKPNTPVSLFLGSLFYYDGVVKFYSLEGTQPTKLGFERILVNDIEYNVENGLEKNRPVG